MRSKNVFHVGTWYVLRATDKKLAGLSEGRKTSNGSLQKLFSFCKLPAVPNGFF